METNKQDMTDSSLILNDSPLNSAQPAVAVISAQVKPNLNARISKANASELGKLGVQARLRNQARLRQEAQEAERLKAEIAAQPDAFTYANARLLRVRGQLDALDEAIRVEVAGGESKRLKELVEAQRHLSEQERILAGRPLPGSHRPSSKPTKPRTPENYGPVE